jgi:uncharacterized damage-inducible protein DinB
MIEQQHLVQLMTRELATTLKVMRAYPGDKPDFRAHERSNSALQLFGTFVIELSIIEGAFAGAIDQEKMKYMPENLKQGIEDFEKADAKVIELVKNASKERYEKVGDFFGMKMSAADVAEFMLLDQVHHRGQLSVYVRMAGGKVPSIYGPSADEPFTTK